ncbi:Kin of IRRE-like protein 1 [Melipona quadrifasciata]|uniref:Kin of IRRE-like protein 1 n=1 Tax=Melipona quadrifasciata TaxID=166423 RepID=A0A0M8ZUD9_9HYME|nr:Kin of IRRE-like protein 1 [Melipona quadrifasciata]
MNFAILNPYQITSICFIRFISRLDTLSLGDRTMDNMDRHASQNRPRNQLLADPSGLKPKVEPTFDYSQNTNVTALIGKTAYLTCRVRNLGDKTIDDTPKILFRAPIFIISDYCSFTTNSIETVTFEKVSWVRHRDIHILTAGAYTYTSDQRFQALHRQNTGQSSEWSEWTLCIKWAQERDQGLYECQISTIPVKSHQFRLNVVVPTATILGGPELYVGAGSTINLTCAIHFSSEPPAYIFWYYNENVLSYDSPRGGVSVITEKGGDVTTSWLLIQTAQPSDSGEYSCKPSNANTASIKVHVLNEPPLSFSDCLSQHQDLIMLKLKFKIITYQAHGQTSNPYEDVRVQKIISRQNKDKHLGDLASSQKLEDHPEDIWPCNEIKTFKDVCEKDTSVLVQVVSGDYGNRYRILAKLNRCGLKFSFYNDSLNLAVRFIFAILLNFEHWEGTLDDEMLGFLELLSFHLQNSIKW